MSGQSDHELVLEDIRDKGQFDTLRKQVYELLKKEPSLKEYIMQLFDESSVAKDPAKLLPMPKKKILDDMRREFESKLAEKVLEIADSIIFSEEGPFAQELEQMVQKSLCELYTSRVKEQMEQLESAARNTGRPH